MQPMTILLFTAMVAVSGAASLSRKERERHGGFRIPLGGGKGLAPFMKNATAQFKREFSMALSINLTEQQKETAMDQAVSNFVANVQSAYEVLEKAVLRIILITF